ncbi:MAG: NADAR family protein [Methylococcaceae bacterium]|nr:NADAR family protein [Methylococcaceae bacterium]
MSLNQLKPNPQTVTINGCQYTLVAFYYPDRNTAWDNLFQGQFLTNFYPCTINMTINAISASFHNAEAAFQATKWWNNPADLSAFEAAKTGSDAFHIKKQLANPDNSYAELGRDGAMKTVLTQKFSDPAFQQALLATGDAYLLEHKDADKNPDSYWSDYNDGSGLNMLGKTLMELREALGGSPMPTGNFSVADFTAQVKKLVGI